jgi:uncharacterized membrane protein YdjX (TVP38/TMEM64 family)|tara:strand:- start:623 stop:766 length:144 start_codon:yes stop_codon:yes gene_type:complete
MTAGFGVGMFFYSMGALLIGAVIAYYVINKVYKSIHTKRRSRWDDLE